MPALGRSWQSKRAKAAAGVLETQPASESRIVLHCAPQRAPERTVCHAPAMPSEMSLGTPALLFPAISLLLLAYTNRFFALATAVRALHARYQETRDRALLGQIQNLRQRLGLIRSMQWVGVFSLLLCVVCMFALFAGFVAVAKFLFGLSLAAMTTSLAISMREIQISTVALTIQLSDLEAVAQDQQRGTPPEATSVGPEA